MHVTKIKRMGVGQILAHINRSEKDRNYSNENINHSNTHLNYAMIQNDYVGYEEKLSRYYVSNKKDVNTLVSICVTIPKEYLAHERKDELIRYFFEDMTKCLTERYGVNNGENIISAVVHMDEDTPHLHFAFIPVVPDKKHDKYDYKVCAKDVITRNELQRFHPEVCEKMKAYGMWEFFEIDHALMNGKTKLGNQTIAQLKSGKEAISAQMAEILRLQAQEKAIRERIEKLQEKKLDELDKAIKQAYEITEQNIQLRKSIREFEQEFQNHVERAYEDVFDEKDMERARMRSEAILQPKRTSLDKKIREASEGVQRSREQAHRMRENLKKKTWGDR